MVAQLSHRRMPGDKMKTEPNQDVNLIKRQIDQLSADNLIHRLDQYIATLQPFHAWRITDERLDSATFDIVNAFLEGQN